MRRGRSLRRQLLGAMVLIFSLGVMASLVSYGLEVGRLSGNLRTRTLQEQAREFLADVHLRYDGTVDYAPSPAWQKAYADKSGRFSYTLYDATRRPVALSPNLNIPLPFVSVPADKAFAPIDLLDVGPERQAVIAARGPQGYVLVVGRRDIGRGTLVDSLFEEASEQLLVLAPFGVLALAFIWIITWWSLRPITRASRDAAAIGPANPTMRISADGLPREIQPLVDAVNGALDRLAEAYSVERRMTADAAHALRTPLAVISLRIQRARHSGAIDWLAVERELAQMSDMVGQLLDLARKESLSRRNDAGVLPVINLSRLVREAAATIVPLIESQGRQLEVDVPEAVPFRGHADDLRDLIRNLLENALSHGRGNVSVRLRQETGALQGSITIEVADEGDGVPIGMEEEVFGRFRKLQVDSPGAGLGLAIVRQVARSHDGDVRFVRGCGRVIVSLPGGHGRAMATWRPAANSG